MHRSNGRRYLKWLIYWPLPDDGQRSNNLLNPSPALPIRLGIPRSRIHTPTARTSAADLFGLQDAIRAAVYRLQDSATVAGLVAVDSPDVAGGGEEG